jgi:phosphatidate cytidylyltransferase
MDKVLKERAITAFFFVIIVLAALLSGNQSTIIFVGIILMLSTYEIARMSIKKGKVIRIIALLNLVIFYLLNYWEHPQLFFYIATGAVIIHLYLLYNVFKNNVGNLHFFSKNLLFLYPLLAFLSYVPVFQNSENAHYLLLILLLLIWVCDTAAYLTGRKLGKKKLFERVSPKKTVEGFFGSLLFTPLLSLFIPVLFPGIFEIMTPFSWVMTGLMVAIFGTLGDLYQSQIKRIYGVKDSGKIMPGHGGIWDRFDSFIFLLPFYSLILQITMDF